VKIKKFALLLLILLLFCALIGCEKIDLSGGENSSSETKPTPQAPSGTVLSVRTTVSGKETFRPDAGTSLRGDAALEALLKAEQTSGLTLDVQIVSRDSMASDFVRLSRAGSKYADLIQADGMFLSRYFSDGYLLSLEDAGISPSDTGTMKTVDGIPFALRTDARFNPLPTASGILFYNEKLLLDHGLETPLQLFEDGVWNWGTFENLCSQIPQSSSGEFFSFSEPVAGETDLIWATLHSAGALYFDKDGVCTMDSNESLRGFDALRRLSENSPFYRLGSFVNDTADPTAKLAFTNRRTVFYVGNISEYFDTAEDSLSATLQEDLRIIGFPALKTGVSGAFFTQEDIFLGITSLADKANCKTFLEALRSEEEARAGREEVISDYFHHEEDGELFFDLLTAADTHSALGMADNYATVDEFFLRIAGGGSAKEILNNLQIIFNSPTKG